MKNLKIMLVTIFLLIFVASSVLADSFDMNYSLPEQIPTLGPGGSFDFGFFWPALGELNQELKSMGLAGLGGGFSYGGTFGYSFSPNWQLGYEGVGWSNQSSGIISGTVKTVTLAAGMSNLVIIYKTPYGRDWNLSLGLAPGLYTINYTKEISSGPYQYGDDQTPINATTSISRLSGSAWGLKVFANLKYILNPIISLGLSLGYQYAKIKELCQAGTRIHQAPIIDLSGITLKLGALLNF